MKLRILIACECSGAIRRAFRALGHNAYSCDLKPAEDDSPYHVQGDAIAVLTSSHWDLVIAHPSCQYLCNSGVLRLYLDGKKRNGIDHDRWKRMRHAALFFHSFFHLYSGPLCLENPVMHGHARAIIGHKDCTRQTIQPFEFGADASKATVLWLRGLPRSPRTRPTT